MVAGLNYTTEAAPPSGGGGGGGDMVTMLSAPDYGYGSQIATPRAQALGNYTYVAHLNSAGTLLVTVWDHSTDAFVATRTIKTGWSIDAHNQPALLIEANTHKLWVAYCQHNGSTMYLRRSTTSLDTDPDLGDGFAAEQSLHSQLGGWADYTYPTLVQLTGEASDPVYLLYRKHHSFGRLMFSTTTDGTTWATEKMIYYVAGGSFDPYWKIGTDGVNRIDFLIADGPTATINAYHFYYDGSWRTSDGTVLTGKVVTGAGGSDAISYTDVTQVIDSTNGVVDRITAMCWDGTNPSGTVWQKNGTTTRRLVRVTYSAGWTADTVVDDVGGFLGTNTIASWGELHPTDPDTAYVAVKSSGVWQMYRYVYSGSWSGTALTSGSGDNFNPTVVRDNDAALEAIWPYGSFTSDSSFSVGLRGMPAA